jgi:hypothetical protein
VRRRVHRLLHLPAPKGYLIHTHTQTQTQTHTHHINTLLFIFPHLSLTILIYLFALRRIHQESLPDPQSSQTSC